MEKLRKGKVFILILLLILIIFELIAFQNSRAEKVITISANFSDSKNLVEEVTENIEATDKDESGYSVVLPDKVNNKKISKYYITSKLINESNEIQEENVVEKLPGDNIYLTEDELKEKQINFEIDYDIKDDLYNQSLTTQIDNYNVTIEGYLPLNAELKAIAKDEEELIKENEDIDEFINASFDWKSAYEFQIISEEEEFKSEEKLKITFESTEEENIEANKYKVININNKKLTNLKEFELKGNKLRFDNDKLGTYIIIQEVEPIKNLALTRAITENGIYENVWDGTVATEIKFGTGTSADPYLITNAGELSFLANQVNSGNTYENQYFQLASNINLNGNTWTPIGNTNTPFKGIFDGAGHYISNMQISITSLPTNTIENYGLFGTLGDSNNRVTIKNLELRAVNIIMNSSGTTANNTTAKGWHIGGIVGTMYNNSTIENCIVTDLAISGGSNITLRTNYSQLAVGGIAGYATNTSNNTSDPGNNNRYEISNCYVKGNINLSVQTYEQGFWNTTIYGDGQYHTAGIIGTIRSQPVWPTNCLFNGNIDSNGFIGPIFAGLINTANFNSRNNYNTIWNGNDSGNLTMESYYTNYQAGGRSYTANVTNGNSSNRNSRDSDETEYVQGVNKGRYTNNESSRLNSFNTEANNKGNMEWTYEDGEFKLNPRFELILDESGAPVKYRVDVKNDYSSGPYTYTWYFEGEIVEELQDKTEVSHEQDLFQDFVYTVVAYDGTYYSVMDVVIERYSLYLEFTENTSNKTLTSKLAGDALPYIDLDDYTYQWYSLDITGEHENLIEGETSLTLDNLEYGTEYKLIATNNEFSALTVEGKYLYGDRTVVYCNHANGNDRNDGFSPDTPVQNLSTAYSKLDNDGTRSSNIIVIMGTYDSNSIYNYKEGSNNANTYAKKATLTGKYSNVDYNGILYFYSGTYNYRYITEDTTFQNLTFYGGRDQMYFYLQGHSLTMGEGITMQNYATSNTNQGLLGGNAPAFHIFCGWNQYNYSTLPRKNAEVIIKSGTYGRIVGGGSPGTSSGQGQPISHDFMGSSKEDSFNITITIDIQNSTTADNYDYDVNLLTGGSAAGNNYSNVVQNIKNGSVGRLIGGSIGDSATIPSGSWGNPWNYPNNTFLGTAKINVTGGCVDELYGGCLGRNMDVVGSSSARGNTCDSYYYGTIDINISGGEIISNIYGAGAGGVTGYSENSSDPYKSYGEEFDTAVNINLTGGTVGGNIYGGGYGYTEYLNANVTAVDGGSLYGDSNITISGNPTINGDIYAAGCGYNYRNKQEIAQMEGNSNIDISGTPVINGKVFGAGAGVSGYAEMAKLIGTSNINISANLNTEVYGGGNIAKTQGNTNLNILNGTHTAPIYGGGNIGQIDGNATVNINGGTQSTVYGGGNQAKVTNSTVNINGGTNTVVFAGGNSADVETTNVLVTGGNTATLYGGSNQTGNINISNINATGGTVGIIYGGNNVGGNTTDANVTINGGSVTDSVYGGGNEVDTQKAEIYLIKSGNNIPNVYGGGNQAGVTEPHIYGQGGQAENVYGGSNQSGDVPNSEIIIDSGTFGTIYGGNNAGGVTTTSDITINSGKITSAIYGGGNQADTQNSNIVVNNNIDKIPNIFGGGYSASVVTSFINIDGGTIGTVYGGSNTNGTVPTTNVNINGGVTDTVYGGNNMGGNTITANVNVYTNGTAGDVYGGGNEAITTETKVVINGTVTGSIYGGGNLAQIETSTDVLVENAKVTNNVYGGGNEGIVQQDANVHIKNSELENSVYAGGNGTAAIVKGNTLLTIDGSSTKITKNAFGGGNKAATGEEGLDTSLSTVDIVSGEIGGNVYGGANTSVVYGKTKTSIGFDAVQNQNLEKGDLHIGGTVFGGGEANESGDEIYDFDFISVTKGIEIFIDGNGYDNFDIDGSIFGSGNASSTSGTSTIDIKNYGTPDDPKYNISIQRTNTCTISNSSIALDGATDRTNEYSDTYYALSRVDNLKLKNNSVLYMDFGANLLRKFDSLVDINGQEVAATVTIDGNGNTQKNVDNRIYMAEGRNLNIATNEQVTAYGEVNGMTFFGLYTNKMTPSSSTGLYDHNYDNGDEITNPGLFSANSYVMAQHKPDHDITLDGFYTNYNNDGKIKVNYVDTTPKDDVYYIWSVGEAVDVTVFEVSLIASKYATFGTYELSLKGFSEPNIRFDITGVTAGFQNGVNLVDPSQIPSIADTDEAADNTYGLTMATGNNGWNNPSETTFLTENDGSYTGNSRYDSDNSTFTPTLNFCLYHSQNLTIERSLGEVRIRLQALVPIDDLNYDIKYIDIIVSINSRLYQDDYLEAAITPGDQFGLFTSTETSITNKSSFSTYFSLYIEDFSNTDYFEDYNNYERVLVSTNSSGSPYVLPEGTNITMLDMVTNEYYYYIVKADDVVNNKYIYNVHDFIYMGSTDRKYPESERGQQYYNQEQNLVYENFIFQVNFKDTTLNSNIIDNNILMEVRNKDKQTILGVLGIQRDVMRYSVYNNMDSKIGVSATIEPINYLGKDIPLEVTTDFTQNIADSKIIYDTQYFNQKMGIKLTITDINGNVLQNDSLLGIYFTIDDVNYYPRIDGTTRIKIADKVSNVLSKITINTSNNTTLATGEYTIKIETFGSSDGIYYGLNSSDNTEVETTIINSKYGLKVSTEDEYKIIDKNTGQNKNNENKISGSIEYSSGLENPNITVSLYRRKYDTVYAQDYELVDLADYLSSTLTETDKENEYLFSDSPTANMTFDWTTKNNLRTGTYKLVFKLYDNEEYIGEEYEYIIIK